MNLSQRISRLERTAHGGNTDWPDVDVIRRRLVEDGRTLAAYGPPSPLPVVVPSGDERIDAIRRQLLQDNLDLAAFHAGVAQDAPGRETAAHG